MPFMPAGKALQTGLPNGQFATLSMNSSPCIHRGPGLPSWRSFRALAVVLGALVAAPSILTAARTADGRTWWSEAVEQALPAAGTNRAQIVKALNEIPVARRDAMAFLVENMPARDISTLSAEFLLEHVNLACEGFEQAPWHDKIPKEIFLNDVVPYASVTERRDAWRRSMREITLPLIKDCRTPGEAARRINEKIFGIVKVGYSTKRKRPDQSPAESMETGMATCTGLSIILVDACRSVGVPARVAGTPLWMNQRGNHTWVEVWDGRWHFTGAAEQDPNGLDRGWFTHDASQARADLPQHAIYASSFKRTGLSFPMVWARDVDWVPAVNVTEAYVPKSFAAADAKPRLLVKVLDRPAGQRVAVDVSLTQPGDTAFRKQGRSRDESADLNDILPFEAVPGLAYEIRVDQGGRAVRQGVVMGTNSQQVVVVTLDSNPALIAPSMACYAAGADTNALKPREEEALRTSLAGYFAASPDRQASWKFPSGIDRRLPSNEARIRQLAWEAYRTSPAGQYTAQVKAPHESDAASLPRDLVWNVGDAGSRNLFWLELGVPARGERIEASCAANRITVKASTRVTELAVWLDGRLVDFEKPVTLDFNGHVSTQRLQPSLRTLCETMAQRGDPGLAFAVRVPVVADGFAREIGGSPQRTATLRNPSTAGQQ